MLRRSFKKTDTVKILLNANGHRKAWVVVALMVAGVIVIGGLGIWILWKLQKKLNDPGRNGATNEVESVELIAFPAGCQTNPAPTSMYRAVSLITSNIPAGDLVWLTALQRRDADGWRDVLWITNIMVGNGVTMITADTNGVPLATNLLPVIVP